MENDTPLFRLLFLLMFVISVQLEVGAKAQQNSTQPQDESEMVTTAMDDMPPWDATEGESVDDVTALFTVDDNTAAMTTEFVSDTFAKFDDVCSITCPDMQCYSEDNNCVTQCINNALYCLNDATCMEPSGNSAIITCNCRDGFSGLRCEEEVMEEPVGKPDLYIGIIAASAIAGVVLLAILLITCINFCNKKRIRTGKPDELFGLENVVALELSDERSYIEGTATQTDESFLLARSHVDGVPPKPGHSHKIMQTNDSFLLAKAELLRAHGLASRHMGAGSPVGVVSANTRQLSGPFGNKAGVGSSGATPIPSTSAGNGVTRKVSTKKDRAPEPPQDGPLGPSTSKTIGQEQAQSNGGSKTEPSSIADGGNQESSSPFPPENGAMNSNGVKGDEGQRSMEPDVVKKSGSDISPGRRILKV